MTQQPNGTGSNGTSKRDTRANVTRKEVKIVIVGDGGCGKTCLLMVYAKGSFPELCFCHVDLDGKDAVVYLMRPLIKNIMLHQWFEKYTTNITIGNKEVLLHLYDTAGQEDYDRLRPLSYQDVNLVLICYDVTNPTSFDNVLIKWYPEVHHFCRGVPIILIGCKTDLRKDKERLRKLKTSQQEPITYFQGEATCKNIQAEEYLECSAKFRENVQDVFREATLIALNSMKKEQRLRKKHKQCLLL